MHRRTIEPIGMNHLIAPITVGVEKSVEEPRANASTPWRLAAVVSFTFLLSTTLTAVPDPCDPVVLPNMKCQAKGTVTTGSCFWEQGPDGKSYCLGSKTQTRFLGCNECVPSGDGCSTFYDQNNCDKADCKSQQRSNNCVPLPNYACDIDPTQWPGWGTEWPPCDNCNDCRISPP